MDIWKRSHVEQLGDCTGVEDEAEKFYILKYGMVCGGVSVLAASFIFCSVQVTD